jgi:prepilin signal peptidase PulO-like enzyme (type II secretory pathway)
MSTHIGYWIDAVIFFLALVPIIVVDIRIKRIPDALVLAALLLICLRRILFIYLLALESGPLLISDLFLPCVLTPQPNAGPWFFLDGAIGFAFIWAFRLFSKGKIGLGDAKLSGLMALFLGIPAWILAIFAASITGIIYALVQMARAKMKRQDRIPFAPFLGFGALAGFILSLIFGWIG